MDDSRSFGRPAKGRFVVMIGKAVLTRASGAMSFIKQNKGFDP